MSLIPSRSVGKAGEKRKLSSPSADLWRSDPFEPLQGIPTARREVEPVFRPKPDFSENPEIAAWGNQTRPFNPRVTRLTHWIGCVTCLALIGTTLTFLISNHDVEVPANNLSADDLGASDSEIQNEAEQIVRNFLNENSVEKLARFVRHPDITLPRMREYYGRKGASALRASIMRFLDHRGELEAGHKSFHWLQFELENQTARTAIFEATDAGVKLDWESFVYYSDIPWESFLDSEPSESIEFRVLVQPVMYYNHAFTDPGEYLAMKLTDPFRRQSCWGYAERNSATGAELRRLVNRALRASSLTNASRLFETRTDLESGMESVGIAMEPLKLLLKIRFPQNGSGRGQVLIEEVVSDHWVKA